MTDKTAIKPDVSGVDTVNKNERDDKKDDKKKAARTPDTGSDRADQKARIMTDVRALRAKALQEKVSGLGAIKVTSSTAASSATKKPALELEDDAEQSFEDFSGDSSLAGQDSGALSFVGKIESFGLGQTIGVVLTLVWMVFCAGYAISLGLEITPQDMGAFLAGAFAPPALLWMIISAIGRKESADRYADVLRSELRSRFIQPEKTAQVINSDIDRLASIVQKQIKGLEALSLQNARSVDEFLTNIQDQKDTLSRSAQLVTEQYDMARKISEDIKGIETSALSATARMSQTLNAATAGTESISAKMLAVLENLEKSTHDIQDRMENAVETAGVHVKELRDIGMGNIDNLSDLLSRLEDVRDSMSVPMTDVHDAIVEACDKHKVIEQALVRHVEDLNAAREKAVEASDRMGEVLDERVERMSGLSERVLDHGNDLDERMSIHREGLGKYVDDTLGMMDKIQTAVEEKTTSLGEVVRMATADVVTLRDELSESGEVIAKVGTEALCDLQLLDKSMKGNITLIAEQADQVSKATDILEGFTKKAIREMEPVRNKTVEMVDTTLERFEKLKTGFHSLADVSVDRLDKAGDLFSSRVKSLGDEARTVSGLLRESGEDIQNCLDKIEDAAGKAQSQMDTVSESFDNQSSDIHLMADQILLRAESVQRAVGGKFDSLSSSMDKAMGRLDDLVENLSGKASTIQDATDETVQKFVSSGRKINEEADVLREAAQRTVEEIEDIVQISREEANGLVERTKTMLTELRQDGNVFVDQAQEVTRKMVESLRASKEHGEELRAQMDIIASASAQSSKRLDDTVSTLVSTMDTIGTAANDAVVRIEQVRGKMKVEADELIGVSSAALEAAYETTITFKKQSETLFRASRKASQVAKEIEVPSLAARRSEFLRTAKFIVESLHSMSVDMSRMIEGSVSEKTWKSFQKGDVSAFTRKLVDMSDKMPLQKAREKFKKDSEFRVSTQRYLRQFEELYEQALDTDHDGLLISTIGSSESGKLYDFLCAVSDRKSKLKIPDAA